VSSSILIEQEEQYTDRALVWCGRGEVRRVGLRGDGEVGGGEVKSGRRLWRRQRTSTSWRPAVSPESMMAEASRSMLTPSVTSHARPKTSGLEPTAPK
jgi:hypothetical protein